MGEVHTHRNRVINILKTWGIYRIPAFLLWYYLISNLMNTLDYKIEMFKNVILVTPFIVIVFAKVFRNKNSEIFLFLGYTIVFPFILLIIVLFFLIKLLKLPFNLVSSKGKTSSFLA